MTIFSVPTRVSVAITVASFLFGVAGIAIFDYKAPRGVWDGMVIRKPPPNSAYCEYKRLDETLRTPANSWSNLAYWAAGSIMIGLACHDYSTSKAKGSHWLLLPTPPTFLVLSGIMCCFLAVGSFVFHASVTTFGQQLDFAGMGVVLLPPIACAMFKLRRCRHGRDLRLLHSSHKQILSAAIVACIIVAGARIGFIVVLSFFLLGWLEFGNKQRRQAKTRKHVQLLVVIMGSFALAILVRFLGSSGYLCDPKSFFQPHSLWHLLTAVPLLGVAVLQRVAEKESILPQEQQTGTEEALQPASGGDALPLQSQGSALAGAGSSNQHAVA
jgi:hypothetical protein